MYSFRPIIEIIKMIIITIHVYYMMAIIIENNVKA